MTDFRYHLVSLVTVSLALAVGIVLDAGPLAQPISETLVGQVDKPYEDRNALDSQLAESKEKLATSERVPDAFARRIFDKLLAGVSMAVVVLPGADGENVEKISEKISQAGRAVSAQINLRGGFFSPEKRAYQEALSGQVTQHLEDTTRVTTPEDTLMAAVGQLAFIGQNEVLTGVLSVADTPLPQVVTPAKAPVRVGMIIGSRSDRTKSPADDKDNGTTHDKSIDLMYLELARTLNSFMSGVVAFGAGTTPTDLISIIRFESTPVSTVDSIESASALLVLPFALVPSMNGTAEAWGAESGATTPVPPLNQKITSESEPPVEPSQTAPNSKQPGRWDSSPTRLTPHGVPTNPANQSLEAHPNPKNRPETRDRT